MLEKKEGNLQRARDLLLKGLKAVPEESRQARVGFWGPSDRLGIKGGSMASLLLLSPPCFLRLSVFKPPDRRPRLVLSPQPPPAPLVPVSSAHGR